MKKSKSYAAVDLKQEKDWRAESDARTLTEAADIRKDKPRLKAAIDYAKTKVQQLKGIVFEAAEDDMEYEDDE